MMSLRVSLTLFLLLCLSTLALAGPPASPAGPQAPAVTAAAVPAPVGTAREVPAWLQPIKNGSSKQPATKAPLDGVFATCTCGAQYTSCRNSCAGDANCLSLCQDDYQCCLTLCRGGFCS